MNRKRDYETATIYVLRHPQTFEVRYVGVTVRSLPQRLRSHLKDPTRCHRTNWIAELGRSGIQPIIQEAEVVPFAQWQARERQWIAHLLSQGHPLTNNTGGGDGRIGAVLSETSRAKMSESAKQHYAHNPEAKLVISRRHRGKTISNTQRAAVGAANKKRWAEYRSAGMSASPETREKIAASRRGKPLAKAHRVKLSKASKGVPKSPEHRAKLAAHCRAMSAARNN